jgi:hypothetical protein
MADYKPLAWKHCSQSNKEERYDLAPVTLRSHDLGFEQGGRTGVHKRSVTIVNSLISKSQPVLPVTYVDKAHITLFHWDVPPDESSVLVLIYYDRRIHCIERCQLLGNGLLRRLRDNQLERLAAEQPSINTFPRGRIDVHCQSPAR